MSTTAFPAWCRLGASALALCLFSISPLRAAEEDDAPAKEAIAGPALAQAPGLSSEKPASQVESSVVKVFATQRLPDFLKPWGKQQPREVTGSGVVIDGKRILTNAHVVQYSSQIQVQANQSGNKISAKVVAIDPGVDLALLTLEDESFFDTQKPLPFGAPMPSVKDSVMVYGFPTGGSSLSITKGIVSRIEFAQINYGTAALRVQIDAAINPGNSGGPAVVDDKLIGVAFSKLAGNTQNIGYIIPCDEIQLFLKNVDAGKPLEKGSIHDESQTLSNQALRDYLKLPKNVEGVLINRIDSNAADYPLKKWDVVTRIGSTPIDNEGKVKIGDSLRLDYRYLIQKEAREGKVALTVLRAGKELVLSVPLEYRRPRLIPFLSGDYPDYFIYGPVVFSAVSEEFLSVITAGNASLAYAALSSTNSPLLLRRGERPTPELQEIVVVPAPFFPHKLTKGYARPTMRVVSTIDDIPVRSLRHLVELLRDAKGDYVKIEFAGRNSEALLFPRKETAAATEEILTDNGIRSQGSPDLLKVWGK
jgi:S1-C subfamily serine protease